MVGNVRDLILSAATRLIAARGFDGMTVQAVADAVGIRKPSVLHHFPSKEALRQGVIDDMLEHWSRVLPEILRQAGAGAGSPNGPNRSVSRFDALTRELVRFFAADPDRARLLVRETLDRPREIRRLFAQRVRPWLAILAEAVREGQRAGLYHADLDADSYLVHMLHLIVVGIAAGGVLSPGGEAPREALEHEIHELLRIARTSLLRPDAKPTKTPPATRERGRRS